MIKSLAKVWGSGLGTQFCGASTVYITHGFSYRNMSDGISNVLRVKPFTGKISAHSADPTLLVLQKYLDKLLDEVLQSTGCSVPQYLAQWPELVGKSEADPDRPNHRR